MKKIKINMILQLKKRNNLKKKRNNKNNLHKFLRILFLIKIRNYLKLQNMARNKENKLKKNQNRKLNKLNINDFI